VLHGGVKKLLRREFKFLFCRDAGHLLQFLLRARQMQLLRCIAACCMLLRARPVRYHWLGWLVSGVRAKAQKKKPQSQ